MDEIKFKSVKEALKEDYRIYTFHYEKMLKEWFIGLKKRKEKDAKYIGFWTKSFPKYITKEDIIFV